MRNVLNGSVSRLATSYMLLPVAAFVSLVPCVADAQLLCLPGSGISILCSTDTAPTAPNAPAPVPPVPVVGPAAFSLLAGVNSTTGINLTTIGTDADLTVTPVTTAIASAVGTPALALTSGGGIDARITTLSATGSGAGGAVLRAVDDVLFKVDGLVSTVGSNAPGVDIQGGRIIVSAGDVVTAGDSADGAQLLAINGPAVLTADLIDTSGGLSTAALLRAAGNINVDVGVLRTAGGAGLGPGYCDGSGGLYPAWYRWVQRNRRG